MPSLADMDLSKPVNLKIVWVGPLIVQLNPDNLTLQGKSNKVRVIEGKIRKKITWRGIGKDSS